MSYHTPFPTNYFFYWNVARSLVAWSMWEVSSWNDGGKNEIFQWNPTLSTIQPSLNTASHSGWCFYGCKEGMALPVIVFFNEKLFSSHWLTMAGTTTSSAMPYPTPKLIFFNFQIIRSFGVCPFLMSKVVRSLQAFMMIPVMKSDGMYSKCSERMAVYPWLSAWFRPRRHDLQCRQPSRGMRLSKVMPPAAGIKE